MSSAVGQFERLLVLNFMLLLFYIIVSLQLTTADNRELVVFYSTPVPAQ